LPDGKSCQVRENKVTTTTTTEASYKERDIEELEDHDFAVEFVNLNKRINKIEKVFGNNRNELMFYLSRVYYFTADA
jgi:hypothetical protein